MAYEFVSARFGELGTRHNRARVGVLLFFLISFECRCKAIRSEKSLISDRIFRDTGRVGTAGEITPAYVFCKVNKWFKDRKRGNTS